MPYCYFRTAYFLFKRIFSLYKNYALKHTKHFCHIMYCGTEGFSTDIGILCTDTLRKVW